ncbi:MAG: hypothetical protein ACRD15_06480 [Vicinamibacterales bacterium]
MANPHPTGLVYAFTVLLALMAGVALWEADYLSAASSALLALAMGIVGATEGRPGKSLSVVTGGLIIGALGISAYGWIG